MNRVSHLLILILVLTSPVRAAEPWPWGEPTDLTSIEGPGTNDFHQDLSGACWNPLTRVLWVCRNGPGGTSSKIWAVVEDGVGGWQIDERDALRGEWTGFGDLEGIAVADRAEEEVFAMVEGVDEIREYDLATYGTAVLQNTWDISAHVPTSGGSGSEGITFVPDDSLAAGGFLDSGGAPYTSQNGMGGIFLIAHQNGGRIYAFDLDRTTGGFDFVGEYATALTESCGLELDRSTHLLHIWHGGGWNQLETSRLSSTWDGSRWVLDSDVLYEAPHGGNLEGLALTPEESGEGWLFLTIDDGGATSLEWYQRPPVVVPSAGSLGLGLLLLLGTLFLHRRT